LAGKGFKDVYNLKGGIKAWHGLTAAGPPEMGMIPLRGDETPQDIIVLAYGMEEGLGSFYATMAERKDDAEVVDILHKLKGIEEIHKGKLFDLYRSLSQDAADKETFEDNIVAEMMEGGFTTEEFLDQNQTALKTVEDVLNVAMMLETQAFDLYSRYSQRIEDERGKAVLNEIADEEKAHLASLGRLMEARS
jgi:rubrerythrin